MDHRLRQKHHMYLRRGTISIRVGHDLTHACMYCTNVNVDATQDRIISNQLCLCISLTSCSELLDVGELLAGSNFQPHPWFVLT